MQSFGYCNVKFKKNYYDRHPVVFTIIQLSTQLLLTQTIDTMIEHTIVCSIIKSNDHLQV
jgi:hypothetical protein